MTADKSERLHMRVSRRDMQRWRRAARAAGLTLSEWLRRVANRAVEEG